MNKLFKWVLIGWAFVAQNEELTMLVIIFLLLAFLGSMIDAKEAKNND